MVGLPRLPRLPLTVQSNARAKDTRALFTVYIPLSHT